MKRYLPFVKTPPVVSVLRLSGSIGTGNRSALSDEALAPMIERAFRRGKPSAVALLINSPGGSPVQSSLIGARIRRLAEEKNLPVLAFVEDVAASGGYWLAAAADEIYADESSILGSIGVISAGFGAHVFLARQGIERRVYTAGTSKSMLDPFRPENPEDVERLKSMLQQIHGNFITHIKSRRGSKLKEGEDLFNGDIWVGAQAVEAGLADGIAHMMPHLKERFGKDVRLRRYGPRRSIMQRFGARIVGDALGAIEERADFARFGL